MVIASFSTQIVLLKLGHSMDLMVYVKRSIALKAALLVEYVLEVVKTALYRGWNPRSLVQRSVTI